MLFLLCKKEKNQTCIVEENNVSILKHQIGTTRKTNTIGKGIFSLTIEPIIKASVKKYFSYVKFDLVMYSTPPMTFDNVIVYKPSSA